MAGTLRDHLQKRLHEVGDREDSCAAATLRLILTAIRDRDLSLQEEGRPPLDDAAIEELLGEMVAQRREEIARCETCGRLEMAAREEREIGVIEDFLPKPLDKAQTVAVVDEAISDTSASDLRDVGRVVARLKEQYRGRLDFRQAKRLICERLH